VLDPDDRHWIVLGSESEEWCMDNLREGVLAEWKGLELTFHFATVHDAIVFKLVWFLSGWPKQGTNRAFTHGDGARMTAPVSISGQGVPADPRRTPRSSAARDVDHR
jgi:hypothetical protein